MLQSGKGADVTLVCGGEKIKAHSLILSHRSPLFAALLDQSSPMACVDLSAMPVLDSITPPTFRRLLEFMYTDELTPNSAEEAQHLLNAADYYVQPRLRAICESSLCGSLSVENVAFTLTLADQHSAADLKRESLRFFARNAKAVMKTEGWAHMSKSKPELLADVVRTLVEGVLPLESGDAVQPGKRQRTLRG